MCECVCMCVCVCVYMCVHIICVCTWEGGGREERMIEYCHRVINCYASLHLKSMREAAMSEPLYPDCSHSWPGKSNRLGYPKGSTVNPSHRRGHKERRHALKRQEAKITIRLSNWSTEAYQPVLWCLGWCIPCRVQQRKNPQSSVHWRVQN
jgi:hypothetical protein